MSNERGAGRPKAIDLDEFFEENPQIPMREDSAFDVGEQLQDLISNFSPENIPFTVTLMKIDNKTNKYHQIDRWEQTTPPSSHEIGIYHGSGNYQYIVNWRDKNTRKPQIVKKTFYLGVNYDKLKRENDRKENQDQQIMPVVQNNAPNSDLLAVIMKTQSESADRMMTMITGIMNNQNTLLAALIARPQQNESIADKLLPELIRGRNDHENDRFKAIQEAFNNGIKLGGTMNGNETSKEIDYTSVINTMIEALPEVVKAFATPRMIRSQIMANPDARTVIQDPKLRAQLLEGATAKHGETLVNKALHKAGLDDILPKPKTEIPSTVSL